MSQRPGSPTRTPDLIPELTKARFVAADARDAGGDQFADRVAAVRDPAFEPLNRFDAVSILASERRREQLDDERREKLRETAGLADANVTLEDDPEVVFSTLLDDREKTFFDYPGTPLHVIEAAESEGLDLLAASPDERAADVDESHRTYVRQRARIEVVVAGARRLATEAYGETIDQITERSPSDRTYDSAEAYASVVAFNAALAAEAMLAEDGELVTPP